MDEAAGAAASALWKTGAVADGVSLAAVRTASALSGLGAGLDWVRRVPVHSGNAAPNRRECMKWRPPAANVRCGSNKHQVTAGPRRHNHGFHRVSCVPDELNAQEKKCKPSEFIHSRAAVEQIRERRPASRLREVTSLIPAFAGRPNSPPLVRFRPNSRFEGIRLSRPKRHAEIEKGQPLSLAIAH